MDQCPVCNANSKIKYKLRFNVYYCNNCQLLTSNASFDHSFISDVQYGVRENGLMHLRSENFKLIIDQLKQITGPSYKQLQGLEIGSGNGWWLRTCKNEGLACTGIEPERTFESQYKDAALNVIYGFYPSNETAGNLYDFIIFNDVFEHIPDVNNLVNSVKENLKPGGIVIINLPLSTGLFYNAARILNKLGSRSFMERMWQFNFHSPHISYFNADNLKRLLNNHGFTQIVQCPLQTLDFDAVKDRIITDKKFNKLSAAMMIPLIKCFKPVIKNYRPDTEAFFFQKSL